MTIIQDDPRAYDYACPTCMSRVGERCTEATNLGRKTVHYIHTSRIQLIEKTDGAVALVFEPGSFLVHDVALNWETAQTLAQEGYSVRAIADDGHKTKEEIQKLCDYESSLRADCFGS